MEQTLTFEEAMLRLEEIVAKLEGGEVPLEDSLALFEEGVRLSRICREKLDEAEKRVEILLKDEAGVFYREPFSLKTRQGSSEPENG